MQTNEPWRLSDLEIVNIWWKFNAPRESDELHERIIPMGRAMEHEVQQRLAACAAAPGGVARAVDLLVIDMLIRALDALVDACTDSQGRHYAPAREAILKACILLAPFKHSLHKDPHAKQVP